jgi:hypothetical protein
MLHGNPNKVALKGIVVPSQTRERRYLGIPTLECLGFRVYATKTHA